MTQRERDRLVVLKKAHKKLITQRQAAEELDLTERHVRRLLARLKESGDRAVIEVTEQPHTGCAKFAARFGRDAHKLVWSEEGQQLRLRGLNARVLVGGTIKPGDTVRRLAADAAQPDE